MKKKSFRNKSFKSKISDWTLNYVFSVIDLAVECFGAFGFCALLFLPHSWNIPFHWQCVRNTWKIVSHFFSFCIFFSDKYLLFANVNCVSHRVPLCECFVLFLLQQPAPNGKERTWLENMFHAIHRALRRYSSTANESKYISLFPLLDINLWAFACVRVLPSYFGINLKWHVMVKVSTFFVSAQTL